MINNVHLSSKKPNQSKTKTNNAKQKKKTEEMEENLRDLWHNNKHINIRVMEVPKVKGQKNISKINGKKLPKFDENH